MKFVFKRKLYDKMLEWKRNENGASALLIKGARRVGKSTLAETFAQKEYESYILIDFSIAPKQVIGLFEDISDLDYFFMRLQMIYHVSLIPRKSVIIFDEVQMQPLARQAIKHLVKDGRYDYIETGSLISIRQNIKDIVIPSEETQVCLNPLDYEEFRWAMGDTATIPLLRQCFDDLKPLSEAINRQMMRDFRLYILVGGMPQAVETYLSSNDMSKVDVVKRRILALYEEDFNKIDPTGKASLLFRSIPAQLAANKSRFIVSGVASNGDRPYLLEETLVNMIDSMTVNVAYHANDPNVGLPLHGSLDAFKLYLADTGLFVTLAFMDKDFTENLIYEKLLSDKLNTDLGYLFENIVAQTLKAVGYNLFYYTFPKDEKHNYEVDFIISKGTKICPIEVKSSGYRTHASMDAFCKKFSSRITNYRYMIYTKDLKKEGSMIYLPAYMTLFV